jgi:hypothetical protein
MDGPSDTYASSVRTLVYVDEAQDWIYFTAGGKQPGMDPYYHQLNRVRPDGSDLTLLTPKDADHQISFALDGSCFVDAYSRVDLARADGTNLMDLETGRYLLPDRALAGSPPSALR